MRITHISDCYLPRLGGIEVQVTELTRRQAARGEDIHVITATPGEEIRLGTEEIDGVTVHRVTARMPFEMPVRPRTRAALAPLLEEIQPDVVQVHLGAISPFAWGGIRAAVEVGLPVLATVHSVWGGLARTGYRTAENLRDWCDRGVQPAAVSRMAADRIAHALNYSGEVFITPNGVDLADWSPAGRSQRSERDPVTFVTAMRLAPRKRSRPLLKMFAAAQQLSGQRQPMRLRIAGDGPHRARLERYVRRHGLADHVEFLGRLARPDLHRIYLESDVYIQPSVKESFGLAALEARTSGLPVIARSQTGLSEFVHDGIEGLLGGDDVAMAVAMARMATDRSLRQSITEHNSTTPPDQIWPQVLDGLHRDYLRLSERVAR